jgi:hypothetical protein
LRETRLRRHQLRLSDLGGTLGFLDPPGGHGPFAQQSFGTREVRRGRIHGSLRLGLRCNERGTIGSSLSQARLDSTQFLPRAHAIPHPQERRRHESPVGGRANDRVPSRQRLDDRGNANAATKFSPFHDHGREPDGPLRLFQIADGARVVFG